jgi:hypothetical protein
MQEIQLSLSPLVRRFLRASESFEKRFFRRITFKVFAGVAASLIGLPALALIFGITRFYIPATVLGLIVSGSLLWAYRDLYRTESKALRGFAKARQANTMRALHVSARDVVALQGVEGKGDMFAFQMADNRIIFVEVLEASAKFPNDNFTLWRLLDDAGAELTGCIEKHGNQLQPSRTLSGSATQSITWRPDHLQTISGRLADLETVLHAPQA